MKMRGELEIIRSNNVKIEIEVLNACPVCKSDKVKVLYRDLPDLTFFSSDQLWRLSKCTVCGSGYLSPRPTKSAISLAYESYYTHDEDNKNSELISNKLLSAISGRYIRKHTQGGCNNIVDLIIYWFVTFFYPLKTYIDGKCRHLYYFKCKPLSLLDIGCGSGKFLLFAKNMGWDVVGMDLDAKAIKVAKEKGLEVWEGDIGQYDIRQQFNVITISHVVEHIYNPKQLLKQCYRALQPGGYLWIQTPNIDGIGSYFYKRHWRGLEPPRHLIIFNSKTIRGMLEEIGYESIQQKYTGLATFYTFKHSELIRKKEKNLNGSKYTTNKVWLLSKIVVAEIFQIASLRRNEFVTFIARKPANSAKNTL